MIEIANIKLTIMNSQRAFRSMTSFSEMPGIYGIFYIGDNLNLHGIPFKSDHLLYIGKTESSQKQRDANTHFKSGKTGSSTLRKSLGSLLRDTLRLVPIPRSNSDIQKGRTSAFKFDGRSEILLTEWMVNNLGVSFYEHLGELVELEGIESQLVNQLVPPLNLAKNSANPYRASISLLRKMCSEVAYDGLSTTGLTINEVRVDRLPKPRREGNIGLYSNYWMGQLSGIRAMISSGERRMQVQLDGRDFAQLGNRKNYGFRIEYQVGLVTNNLSGSAVARDFSEQIDRDRELHALMLNGNFVFRMGKDFKLVIENLNVVPTNL